MKKFIFAWILSMLFLHVLVAQSQHGSIEKNGFCADRVQRIDQYVNALVQAEKIPGAVVYIARNGETVYHKSFGFFDMENHKELKKDDIFRIASQTKAVVSTAAMMLWEEGRFGLDDPISLYIPEFASPTVLKTYNEKDTSYTAEPAGKEITVRQLMTHTSGLDYPAIGSKEFRAIYEKEGIPSGIGFDNNVLAEKMKILGKLPLKHIPGDAYTYGLGIDVLGYLVEIWSGMSLDVFLKERIFKALKMYDTRFYLPEEKHDRLVKLYDGGGKLRKIEGKVFDNSDPDYPLFNGSYFSGGAGLSSTVEDYARFLQMYLNQGELDGQRILGRKTIELIMTNQLAYLPDASPVGLVFGLVTQESNYKSILSTNTFLWGGAFNTHYWADPQENLIGLIYTNIYRTKHWSIGERFKTLCYQAICD
jgi:CubicO group peptidase (beta-lactamase class C family)